MNVLSKWNVLLKDTKVVTNKQKLKTNIKPGKKIHQLISIWIPPPFRRFFEKIRGGVSVAASFFLRISLMSKNFGASRRFKRGGDIYKREGIHRVIN